MSDTDLEIPDSPKSYGSLERGIAGQFDFSVGGVLKESWESVKGNKGTIWLSILIVGLAYACISFVVNKLLSLVGSPVPDVPSLSLAFIVPSLISNLVVALLTTPLTVGIWMLSLKLASGQKAEATDVVKYYSQMVKLFLAYLAIYALVILGFCLLVVPGIYLAVAYFMALPLIVEKNLGIWQAMEASRKAVNHIWFSLFGFFIVITLIMIVAAIPLCIGLIWALPMAILSYGIIYRRVFGIEPAVTVNA